MSTPKYLRADVPDGLHLDASRDESGAYRGTLRDSANKLVGHANLIEIDPDIEDDEPSAGPAIGFGPLLVALGIGAVAVGTAAVTAHVVRTRGRQMPQPEIKRIPQETAQPVVAPPAGWYNDGTGAIRWWNGQAWTEHMRSAPQHTQPQPVTVQVNVMGPLTSPPPSRDDTAAESVTMTTAEWQNLFRTMVLARAFSDAQWRLLSRARIVDADETVIQSQEKLRSLSSEQFARQVARLIDHNPQLLEQAAAACPPGWYLDAQGTRRWWDGLQWTEQTLNPLAQLRPSQYPPGWYNDGSGRQRWWTGRVWGHYQS